MYSIEPATYREAEKLNVIVKPSTVKGKKIAVYSKDGKYYGSVGALGMMDYHKFLKRDGEEVANEHRRRYKIRHEKDRHKINSKGYFADKLLWT